MTIITFSRSSYTENVGTRIVARGRAYTPAMTQAACDLLSQQLRELQLREPKLDALVAFERVMRAYPASARIVVAPLVHGYAQSVDGVVEEE